MGKGSWPVEEFNAYLEGLMNRAGIADREELGRLSDVNSATLSRWKFGTKQPSRGTLDRLAGVLNVKPALLWIAAGLASADDLDLAQEPDLRVLPTEVRNLIDLLSEPRLPQDERDQLLAHVGLLISGVYARLDQADQPKRARQVNRLA